MFKQLFNDATTSLFGQIALVIFIVVFTAIVVWTMLRSKKSMDRYSKMPLEDDQPVDPKKPRK